MITQAGEVPPDFQQHIEDMCPLVRALLVDGAEPSSVPVEDLLAELKTSPLAAVAIASGADVLSIAGALDAAACAALRSAVDHERSRARDSVDLGAEHQRNITAAELEAAVGTAAASRLWELPSRLAAHRARDASADPLGAEASHLRVGGGLWG